MALDDADTTVRDAFAEWYGQLRGLETHDPFRDADPSVPRAGFDAASEIEPGALRSGFTVYANAVRFLLSPSGDRAAELESQLDAMRTTLETVHDGHLPIGSYPQPGSPSPSAGEQHDSARLMFGYLLPLSVCWLHGLRGGTPAFTALPRPTAASMRRWPQPAVPARVVAASRRAPRWFPFPAASIMRGTLPTGQADIPLFKNPPPRPLDEELGPPPAPIPVDQFRIPQQGTWSDWPPNLPPPGSPDPVPRVVKSVSRPVPPLPAGFDPEKYMAVASVTPINISKADWTVTVENGECRALVRFHQRTLAPPDVADDRRFKVDVEVKWVRAPERA
jgi:hypothetical protein